MEKENLLGDNIICPAIKSDRLVTEEQSRPFSLVISALGWLLIVFLISRFCGLWPIQLYANFEGHFLCVFSGKGVLNGVGWILTCDMKRGVQALVLQTYRPQLSPPSSSLESRTCCLCCERLNSAPGFQGLTWLFSLGWAPLLWICMSKVGSFQHLGPGCS